MLPFFVICLREGLEAALIVSIIATFLKRNGAPMRPMWIGVGLAVLLSIGVGVTLKLVEHSLPQDKQEMLETVIGLVAVLFVTGMVLWMRTHARFLKRDLEEAAGSALGDGTSMALAVMGFLAVLREGFETSVFLVATFQAASTTGAAAVGAVLGLGCAIALAYGIYRGGVRINLARFFTITSVFLVFVAAGLVLSSLRTAHEAGWVTIGQATTVDLSWLAPNGSVRAALVTGVLGMPADPRVIELLGWSCYLVPILALVVWPARYRPSEALAHRIRWAVAGAAVLLAAGLALLVPVPTPGTGATAPLDGGGTVEFARNGDHAVLTLDRDGVASTIELDEHHATSLLQSDTEWVGQITDDGVQRPSTLSLTELLAYTGNRVPVGLNVRQAPGPYDVAWTQKATHVVAFTHGSGLVEASATGDLLASLSGGGLGTPRVLTVEDPATPTTWRVDQDHANATAQRLRLDSRTAADRMLWKRWVPIALLVLAAGLAWRNRRSTSEPASATTPSAPTPGAPERAAENGADPDPGTDGRKTHARN